MLKGCLCHPGSKGGSRQPEPSFSGQTWALQVWTHPKGRAGREDQKLLSHPLTQAKCGRALHLRPSLPALVIATARSAPLGSSHPLPLQGDCGSERLSNLPSAILWASGHPIRNYSVCKVPPPSSPAGGPGSRRRGQPSLPSHLRDWRARHPSPPPPARGRIQTESGSQSGAGG